MSAERIAAHICERLQEVYRNRLRALRRTSGAWVVVVPQPTLEGGDVTIFVETARSASVILHDNRRTSLFLEGVGMDPQQPHRKQQIQTIAASRCCEFRFGRLQAVVPRTGDPLPGALGLADCVKTVSDLGLRPPARLGRPRGVAAQLKPRLFEWYRPPVVAVRPRIHGVNDEHSVDFQITEHPYWCVVKTIEGRNLAELAARWISAWIDIRMAYAADDGAGGNGLAGAVTVYPQSGVAPPLVAWTRSVLRTSENIHSLAVPAEDEDAVHATIDRVLVSARSPRLVAS